MNKHFPILNLPPAEFQFREMAGKQEVFDPVRRKYVALTPEEWVRQNLLSFLINHRNYPAHLIAVEYSLKINRIAKRCDIIVFGKHLLPRMILEVKAPSLKLDQKVLDQAVRYNLSFNAPYIVLSNGMKHFVVKILSPGGEVEFLQDIPDFHTIVGRGDTTDGMP